MVAVSLTLSRMYNALKRNQVNNAVFTMQLLLSVIKFYFFENVGDRCFFFIAIFVVKMLVVLNSSEHKLLL